MFGDETKSNLSQRNLLSVCDLWHYNLVHCPRWMDTLYRMLTLHWFNIHLMNHPPDGMSFRRKKIVEMLKLGPRNRARLLLCPKSALLDLINLKLLISSWEAVVAQHQRSWVQILPGTEIYFPSSRVVLPSYQVPQGTAPPLNFLKKKLALLLAANPA